MAKPINSSFSCHTDKGMLKIRGRDGYSYKGIIHAANIEQNTSEKGIIKNPIAE